MTTLAVDTPRPQEKGDMNHFPVVASDIIYEGAAVGLVVSTGHARPLAAATDIFVGFADQRADNSAGAAAAIKVLVVKSGQVQLSVTDALITDIGQAVYAQDDNAFSFNPVSGVFIGYVKRFISAGVVIVEFNAGYLSDPWAMYSVRETLTGTKTFDAQDTGKLFCVTDAGDGDALTLPAIADAPDGLTIMAVGGFGTTAVTIAVAASDLLWAPDVAGTDSKGLLLTKATQRRGDFVTICMGDADGYAATAVRGIWVIGA